MTTFGDVWARQAQLEAEHDKLTCRVCCKIGPIDEAITIWRNGVLIFGIGDCCLNKAQFLITPTERGIEVKGRSTSPITVGANAHNPKHSVNG